MFSVFIVCYIFFAGLGAGAFLCGVAVNLARGNALLLRRGSRAIMPFGAGFYVAAVSFILACVFLVADLGAPQNIINVLFHPFSTIVSAGAWVIGLATLVSLAMAGIVVAELATCVSAAILETLGSLLALLSLLYTGYLLSSMVSVPFWNTWWLVALFVLSGCSCGFAATTLVSRILDGSPARDTKVDRAALVVAALELATLAAYMADRFFAGGASQESVLRLLSGDLAVLFWGAVVAAGVFAPVIFAHLRRLTQQGIVAVGGCICALIGGFFLRYCIVNAAVMSVVELGPLFA